MRRDLWLPRARGRERDGWDLGVGRCRLLHLELVRSLVRFFRTTAGLQRDTPLRLGWLLRVPMTWGSLALPHLPWKVLQTESFSGPTFYQGAQGLSVLPPRPPLYTLAPPRQAAWVRRSCEALEDQNTLDSTDPPLPEMPREDALLGSFSAQQPHQPQTPQRPLWLVARPGSDDSRLLVTAPPAAGQPGFLRRPRLSGRRGQAFWSGAKPGLLAPLRSKPARTPRKPLLCPAVFIF